MISRTRQDERLLRAALASYGEPNLDHVAQTPLTFSSDRDAPNRPSHRPSPLERIMDALADQAEHGHTLETDIATGPHALIGGARSRILKSMQRRTFPEIDRNLQAASDQTMGNTAQLGPRELALLDARLAKAAALIVAAMGTLDAITPNPTKEAPHG